VIGDLAVHRLSSSQAGIDECGVKRIPSAQDLARLGVAVDHSHGFEYRQRIF
jgi:hypothetical protein